MRRRTPRLFPHAPLPAPPVVTVDAALARLLPPLERALAEYHVRAERPRDGDDGAVVVMIVTAERAAACARGGGRPRVLAVGGRPHDPDEAVRCLRASADGYTDGDSARIAALVRALDRRRAWQTQLRGAE